MSIMIDEVLSDIDIPDGNTGENEAGRSQAPGPSANSEDFSLRDAIIRLEKRELRLLAD